MARMLQYRAEFERDLLLQPLHMVVLLLLLHVFPLEIWVRQKYTTHKRTNITTQAQDFLRWRWAYRLLTAPAPEYLGSLHWKGFTTVREKHGFTVRLSSLENTFEDVNLVDPASESQIGLEVQDLHSELVSLPKLVIKLGRTPWHPTESRRFGTSIRRSPEPLLVGIKRACLRRTSLAPKQASKQLTKQAKNPSEFTLLHRTRTRTFALLGVSTGFWKHKVGVPGQTTN